MPVQTKTTQNGSLAEFDQFLSTIRQKDTIKNAGSVIKSSVISTKQANLFE